jgi:hypothetical protein
VLAGSRGESWLTAAEDLAAATRAPLHALRIASDGDLVDGPGRLGDVARIDADGVLLLRPTA